MYEDYDYIIIEQADLDKLEQVIHEAEVKKQELLKREHSLGYETGITDIDVAKLNDVKGLVTKKNIADLFEVGDKTAVNILIHMMTCGYAFQRERTYYTTKEHCKKYIMDMMGKQINLHD